MSWTLTEFAFELEHDPDRRVLFVEGNRDVALWKAAVPITERGETVIYPISELLINAKVEGGERGRLLWYARHIFETPLRDRISFFADADGDRILGVLPPGNVTFTDGRDLESYALTEPCLIRLCLQGFGASEPEASRLLPVVISVARPIGVLRILSAAGELRLPFRRTFERNGLRRFLDGKKFEALLDVVRLVSTLMQNAKIPLSKKDLMLEKFCDQAQALQEYADRDVIHGKDFINALSCIFEEPSEYMEKCIFLSIHLSEIRENRNFRAVEDWVRGAPQ